MRLLRRLAGAVVGSAAAATLLASLVVTTAGTAYAATAPALATAGHPWPGHPGRRIIVHRVRPGETAIGLAVHYHAWTDELLALNHLSVHSRLVVGQRIRIPVVLAAVRRHHHETHHHAHHHKAHHHVHHHNAHHHAHYKAHHRPPHSQHHHHKTLYQRGWRHFRMTRTDIAARIAAEARRQGVAPSLAQAIGWEESGWYQPVVSHAGAIGVMQLLPSSGRWMEGYVGRRLNLRNTWDNVQAGVVLIHVLQDHTRDDRHAIGAYYEGLGGVRDGMSRGTKRYVRNVRAIQSRLEAGHTP